MISDHRVTFTNNKPFIVAIGASAGGLEAIEAFFLAMPTGTNIAFVIIAHHPPSSKSLMPKILGQMTKIPVHQISEGMSVEGNNIYIIPPNCLLSICNGQLSLDNTGDAYAKSLPIDHFFNRLALDQGHLSIAIIFSGMGSDGSTGVKHIKNESGLVLVQDSKTAAYPGMPLNAAKTGVADFVVSPEDMPSLLLQHVDQVSNLAQPDYPTTNLLNDQHLQKIFSILKSHVKHNFALYKKNTIIRRIERRMTIHGTDQIEDYIQLLQKDEHMVYALFKDLLIGVTEFFRDPQAFDALTTEITKLLERKSDGASIRVWVAGCSTGEEAYSVAITLKECLKKINHYLIPQIFATDIDEVAISVARKGIYEPNIQSKIPKKLLKLYFHITDDNRYRITQDIRESVIFSTQNVISDPPFTKLDLICNRNLLIYFTSELQQQILPIFYYALNPGGILFLGTSETVSSSDKELFCALDSKWKLFKKTTNKAIKTLPSTAEYTRNTYTPAQPATYNSADKSTLMLMRTILKQRKTPPCVIIDEHCNIVFVHGTTRDYLELPEGAVRVNFLDMICPTLKGHYINAIHEVISKKSSRTITYNNPYGHRASQMITATVQPILNPSMVENFILIMFEKKKPLAPIRFIRDLLPIQKFSFSTVKRLKNELNVVKASLQSTIQELETANEELRSTNEELQSTNEELKSTNEELETSKEELQSMNEESVTVNSELQSRVADLSKTNDDMRNLLDSSEIAMIFLDQALCIQRFTPKALNIFPLTITDLGRPIKDLSSTINGIDFAKLCLGVLDKLSVKELEVVTTDLNYYTMRIRPYRTINNLINGVVITFENFTKMKLVEKSLTERETMFETLFNITPDLLSLKTSDGRYQLINSAFEQFIKRKAKDCIGKTDFDFFPHEEATLNQQADSEVVAKGITYIHELYLSGVNDKKKMKVSRTPVPNAQGDLQWILCTMREVEE